MMSRRNLFAAALALPALLYLGVVYFYPLFRLLLLSFGIPHFTTENYQRFLFSEGYLAIAGRTLFVSVTVTAICALVGYGTAAFLDHNRRAGRDWVSLLVVVPLTTSLLVRTYAWVIVFGDRGPINGLLQLLHIIDAPVPMVFTSFAVFVGMVHVMLPLMILPIYSVMRGVDRELLRASASLGAGSVRTFLRVYLPQTLPGVASGSMLVFVMSLGFYITPAALGGLNDTMLSNVIAQQVGSAMNFPFAAAIAMIVLAAVMTAMLAAQLLSSRLRATRRGGAFRGESMPGMVGKRWREGVRRRWMRRLNDPVAAARGRVPLLNIAGWSVLIFLILPTLIVVAISFGSDPFMSFPPRHPTLHWYRNFFDDTSWLSALALSVQLAIITAFVALALSTMAAYGFSRSTFRGQSLLRGLLLTPVIVPSVVGAIGMYGVMSSWGLVGSAIGIVLAHVTGAITLAFLVVSAGFTMLDPRLEMASEGMGASRWQTFRRVVMPPLSPSLQAAALLAFIYAFDEVVIASFIGGLQLRTLPLRMWEDMRNQVDPTIAATSALLLLVPVLAAFSSRRNKALTL
ncbi:MAG: ABC transporter permease subunit [Sphingomonas bacterium]